MEAKILLVNKINKIFSSSVLVLCLLHLLIVGLFLLYRFYFYFYYFDDLIQADLYYYIQSFFIGLRLDLIVSSYFLLPILCTIFIPKIGWDSHLYRKFLSIYIFILFSLITIFCNVNIEWFNENGNHINTMFMMYGGTGEVRALILEEYNMLLYVVIWALIIVAFFLIYKKLKNIITEKDTSLISQFISFSCFLVLTVVLIRGGTQERPLDWGYAYFSSSNMGNLAAQNPIFFFGRSYIEMKEEEKYHSQFLKVDNLEKLNYDFNNLMLKYNDNDKTTNLNGFNTPNIILIILESFVAENCNYLNKNQKNQITPFLDELSGKGISFSNCFANGVRSAYGLGSILTSWPVLPGKPIISQVESSFNNNASSNAINIFSKLGYYQTFIYGGDANFDNMKGFCIANGFNEVIDQNHKYLTHLNNNYNLDNTSKGTMWGFYDHDIFNSLFNIIKTQNSYPFFTTIFSTTNHDPFKIPQDYEKYFQDIKTGSKKYLKAKKTMAYNDLALKEFFDQAKKEEWYYNTIFIITADHGLTVDRSLPNHPKNGHIPFIIYSDLFDSQIQIDKIVSQVDIIPTIIDILGEEKYLSHFYGVSGLKKGAGFACRMTDEVIQWITPNYMYYELIGKNKKELFSYNSIWDASYIKVQSDTINHYQKESNIYIKNAYYRFKHNNYEGIY